MKRSSALPSENLNRIAVGARYQLAPGVDLRTSWQYYAVKEATSAATASTLNNNANMIVFGTNVRF